MSVKKRVLKAVNSDNDVYDDAENGGEEHKEGVDKEQRGQAGSFEESSSVCPCCYCHDERQRCPQSRNELHPRASMYSITPSSSTNFSACDFIACTRA